VHRANGRIGKSLGIEPRRILGVAIVPKANRVLCWRTHASTSPFLTWLVRDTESTPSSCSGTFQESEVKGREYQDDPNVHREPSPESVLEEQQIDRGDHGCHQDYVKYGGRLTSHDARPSSSRE
jgi:hypothetical protein